MVRGTRVELFECLASDRSAWRMVRLEHNSGAVGHGECSDVGDLAAVMQVLNRAVDAVEDRRMLPMTPDECAAFARKIIQTLGEDVLTATVVAGLEQACCDLAARAAGQPAWQWLRGTTDDGTDGPPSAAPSWVPLYANLNRVCGGRDPVLVAEAGQRAVAEGFDTVKCAPFDEPGEGLSRAAAGLRRVTALREAVGDRVTVLVDVHEQLGLDDLLTVVGELESLHVGWLEDGVSCTDVDGLRRLRAGTGLRLAGAELARVPEHVLPAAAEGVLDIVMPDVKHSGGFTRAAAIAAAVPQLVVAPHNPSGPIATAASAQLFATAPNMSLLEFPYDELSWRSELVGGGERIARGKLAMTTGPGFGVDLVSDHPRVRPVWGRTLYGLR